MVRLILFAACCVVGTSVSHATNLLRNGSFEERDPSNRLSPRHWTAPSADTALPQFVGEHRDGATSTLLTGDGRAYGWRQTVATNARAFTLSGFVKGDGVTYAGSGQASLDGRIYYKGKPTSAATQFSVTIPSGTYDWQAISIVGQAAGNDQVELVEVSVSAKFSAGRILVDKIELADSDDVSPSGLLRAKVDDFERHLARMGDVDASVSAAKLHLAAARRNLDNGSAELESAKDAWIAAATAISRDVWAKMFPDAMAGASTEARMIFHGGFGVTNAEADASFDRMAVAGCNGTFQSAGSWMSVVYPSKIIATDSSYGDRDPLRYAVDEAKRRGFKSFAYLATLYGSTSLPTGPGTLYAQHPSWFAKGPDPRMPSFPDPANPEVADFIVRAYVELATNYDLDGIGLDYLRYPSETALNYDEHNRRQILDKYGFDILENGEDVSRDPVKWAKVRLHRAAAIADLVKRVREGVKSVKPNMAIVGCLLAEPDVAMEYGQDWNLLATHFDYVVPMNYDERSGDLDLLAQQRAILAKHNVVSIPAIGGMPEVHDAWPISQWAQRIAAQRKAGAAGMIVYRMSGFDPAVAAFLGNGPFSNKAAFPQAK